jgi:monovalent cation:H+ antiporter-2, CPA2 family
MDLSNPIVSIAILLVAALIGGIIAHRLKQPVILGYLVIGIVIGPNALGLVSDLQLVNILATVGVALLLFVIGLEITPTQLREVGKVGIWGGIILIVAIVVAGTIVGLIFFQWHLAQSVLFGLIISMSSTAVCMKVLIERGEVSTVHGRIMLTILIVQDISVVAMMVIIPILDGISTNVPLEIVISAGKGFAFIAVSIILGRWIVPWLLGNVGRERARELFVLTILVLCLVAAIGTQIAGLSVVFGAFLIGFVLQQTKFVHQAIIEITPLKDIFATLFFVSLGMLLDPVFLINNWQYVILSVLLIIAIKVLATVGVIKTFGYSLRVAVLAGAGLFQIGEFGFILAQGGIERGLITNEFYSFIISVAIITMLITPVSMSLACVVFRKLNANLSKTKPATNYASSIHTSSLENRPSPVVIAGFGRVGESIAVGLNKIQIPFVVIDCDPERIKNAKEIDPYYIHGDATNLKIMSQVDLNKARALVITFPDPMAVETTVKNALSINPKLKILARIHRQKDAQKLRNMGVIELINPEYEASFRFIKRLLNIENLDKAERKRILSEFRNE